MRSQIWLPRPLLMESEARKRPWESETASGEMVYFPI